jgi:hypothetical protein
MLSTEGYTFTLARAAAESGLRCGRRRTAAYGDREVRGPRNECRRELNAGGRQGVDPDTLGGKHGLAEELMQETGAAGSPVPVGVLLDVGPKCHRPVCAPEAGFPGGRRRVMLREVEGRSQQTYGYNSEYQ